MKVKDSTAVKNSKVCNGRIGVQIQQNFFLPIGIVTIDTTSGQGKVTLLIKKVINLTEISETTNEGATTRAVWNVPNIHVPVAVILEGGLNVRIYVTDKVETRVL